MGQHGMAPLYNLCHFVWAILQYHGFHLVRVFPLGNSVPLFLRVGLSFCVTENSESVKRTM